MTELDKIRACVLDSLAFARSELDRIDTNRGHAAVAVVKLEAELAAHDRAVAAMVDPAPQPEPAARTRTSIQRPVMALFGSEEDTWTEGGIVEKTGLPIDAVHQFLGRAVRAGSLIDKMGLYRLPAKPLSEAAQ